MAIPVNLAMTAAEFCLCPQFPPQTAWMACHFSPGTSGLSNLPRDLPPGALLILDDQVPMNGHDPAVIAEELKKCAAKLGCCGVLLDFQRPRSRQVQTLTDRLCQTLPCPVAVTAQYAKDNCAAVFLPPLPCHLPLSNWICPWKDREIWLEVSLDREVITLTDKGSKITAGEFEEAEGFTDESLHCHYRVAAEADKAEFHLWRTRKDLNALLEDAEALGIQKAVGLYQELGQR